MLTEPARAAWRAFVPAARSLPVRTIGLVLAVAAAPTLLTMARGGTELLGGVVFAGIVGAAALAFAVEDPAGELLAATPVPLAQRRLVRLAAIAAALAATWLAVGALADGRDPASLHHLDHRGAEAAAVAAVGLAVAGTADRRGTVGPGSSGAVAGPLVVLFVSALAFRVHSLPTIGQPRYHGWWWALALAGAVVAGWSSRDPGS